MILKENKKSIWLIGSTCVIKNEDGSYYEGPANINFSDGIIKEVHRVGRGQDPMEIAREFIKPDEAVINLGEDCYVFPGLIDLHNHIDYNTMPIWNNPIAPRYWDNRHEWRSSKNTQYLEDIKNFYKYMFAGLSQDEEKEMYKTLQFLAEIQAISGGTTTLQEQADISYVNSKGTYPASHIYLRSTGVSTDLGLRKAQKVNSIIDFFKPVIPAEFKIDDVPVEDTQKWKICGVPTAPNSRIPQPEPTDEGTYFRDYLELLKKDVNYIKTTSGGYLVHLAEGRAGNLHGMMDGYSAKEFHTLMFYIKQIPNYREKVEASKLTIIHGCGIKLDDKECIDFINECNIRIVWSPVSNMLLYGDTPEYLVSGIKPELVCLGSDWAPSGSKHIWDEAKFAQFFAQTKYPRIGSELNDRLFDMISYNPAQVLNPNKLGSIQVGKFADLYVVVKYRKKISDSLSNVFRFDDAHTVATFINGNLVFGKEEIFNKLGITGQSISKDYPKEPTDLMVYVPEELHLDFNKCIEKIDNIFASYGRDKKFIRSRLLSYYDLEYLDQINKLKAKI